jgi:hypothetical protein
VKQICNGSQIARQGFMTKSELAAILFGMAIGLFGLVVFAT